MNTEYFRLLNSGEPIQATDECLADDCLTWFPAEQWTVGRPWHDGLKPIRRKLYPTDEASFLEAAYTMGARGGPVVELERLGFEAWMRGHCWALGATWNGNSYIGPNEDNHNFCPRAMVTRQIWASWRDRGALATARAIPLLSPVNNQLPN